MGFFWGYTLLLKLSVLYVSMCLFKSCKNAHISTVLQVMWDVPIRTVLQVMWDVPIRTISHVLQVMWDMYYKWCIVGQSTHNKVHITRWHHFLLHHPLHNGTKLYRINRFLVASFPCSILQTGNEAPDWLTTLTSTLISSSCESCT